MKQTTLSEHDKAINRVVEYINSHINDKPSMNELADIANISGFHFHRIFKAVSRRRLKNRNIRSISLGVFSQWHNLSKLSSASLLNENVPIY